MLICTQHHDSRIIFWYHLPSGGKFELWKASIAVKEGNKELSNNMLLLLGTKRVLRSCKTCLLQHGLLHVLVLEQLLQPFQFAHRQNHLRVVRVQQGLQNTHLNAKSFRARHLKCFGTVLYVVFSMENKWVLASKLASLPGFCVAGRGGVSPAKRLRPRLPGPHGTDR